MRWRAARGEHARHLPEIGLLRIQLPDMPRISELTVDTRMLAMVVAVSLRWAVLCSLAPILQTCRAAAAGLLRTLLSGVGPADIASYLAAAGVLLTVAPAACLIPGRRATAIDPTQALREQ